MQTAVQATMRAAVLTTMQPRAVPATVSATVPPAVPAMSAVSAMSGAVI